MRGIDGDVSAMFFSLAMLQTLYMTLGRFLNLSFPLVSVQSA